MPATVRHGLNRLDIIRRVSGEDVLEHIAHLGAVRKHDFPTIFSDVDRILNCAVKSPDQFRIAVSSCNGYHLLMDAFAKLSGSLSRSFVTDFETIHCIHNVVHALIKLILTATEDIAGPTFIFQGLSSGLMCLGCFLKDPKPLCSMRSSASSGYAGAPLTMHQKPRWSLLAHRGAQFEQGGGEAGPQIAPEGFNLDHGLIRTIFRKTTLFSAAVLFSKLSSLISGQPSSDSCPVYDGTVPYSNAPRRAVSTGEIGVIKSPILVMVLLDQAVRLCQSSPTWGPQVGEIESTIEDTIGLDVVDYTERHDLVKETAIWLFSEWQTGLLKHVGSQILTFLVHDSDKQLLSSQGFLRFILLRCSSLLLEETHCLHQPLMEAIEILSYQSISPQDLWTYLRMGNPLSTGSTHLDSDDGMLMKYTKTHLHEFQLLGKPIPVSRVQSLVAMAYRPYAPPSPPHIHFDMSHDGHGCLLVPPISIPPLYSATRNPLTLALSKGVQDVLASLLSGPDPSGTGVFRSFSISSGFSLTTWMMINAFDTEDLLAEVEPHPIRLVSMINAQLCEQYQILQISVLPHLQTLSIDLIPCHWNRQQPAPVPLVSDASGGIAYIVHPVFGEANTWFHLAVTLEPTSATNMMEATVYANGVNIGSSLIKFFSSFMPQQSRVSGISHSFTGRRMSRQEDSPSAIAYVVGTPPNLRQPTNLRWRLASMHLLDEVLSQQTLAKMHHLGPQYLGSFQGTGQDWTVNEENISLSLHANCHTSLPCDDIKQFGSELLFNNILLEALADAHTEFQPDRQVFVFTNTSLHLDGQPRPIGAFALGSVAGVSTFRPQPLASSIALLGGVNVFLSLISMAESVDMLYASLKALVNNTRNQAEKVREMEEQGEFELLAMLVNQRIHLVTSRVFQLILTLVGSHTCGGDAEDCFVLPHPQAFNDVLCNQEMWHCSAVGFLQWLFSHLVDVITASTDANIEILDSYKLPEKLLTTMFSSRTQANVALEMGKVILAFLRRSPTVDHFRAVALFLVSSVYSESSSAKGTPAFASPESISEDDSKSEFSLSPELRFSNPTSYDFSSSLLVTKRNMLLDILENICTYRIRGATLAAEFLNAVGFDCLFLFMHSTIHPSSCLRAFRFLFSLLETPAHLSQFKTGVRCNLSTLKQGTQKPLFFVWPTLLAEGKHVDQQVLHGFESLCTLVPQCLHVSQVHLVLLSFLLKQSQASTLKSNPPLTQLGLNTHFQFDAIDPFAMFKQHMLSATTSSAGRMRAAFTWSSSKASNTQAMESNITFGGLLRGDQNQETQINTDMLPVLFNMWRASLNTESTIDESYLDPEVLSTLIRFFTTVYLHSVDLMPALMNRDLWQPLILSLIPQPSKAIWGEMESERKQKKKSTASPISPSSVGSKLSSPMSAAFHSLAKQPRRQHSHPTVSSNPASDDLLQLFSFMMIDSFLVDSSISRLTEAMDYLGQVCWTESQTLEAQTTVLRSMMSSIQRLSPLSANSPFVQQKKAGMFQERAKLPIVLFCQYLNDSWKSGLFEGDPTACYRFLVAIVYKCPATAVYCKEVRHILANLILTTLLKANHNTHQHTYVTTILNSLISDQIMVQLAPTIDTGYLLSLAHALPKLAHQAKPTEEDSPTALINRDVSVLAHEVWITMVTWMYDELSAQFPFEYPDPTAFSQESTRDESFKFIIEMSSEKTSKAWLDFCKSSVINKSLKKQTSGLVRRRQSVGPGTLKITTPECSSTEMWLQGRSMDIALEINKGIFTVCQQNSMTSAQREISAKTTWTRINKELLSEGGLWGADTESKMKKWQLNTSSEGPCRMRKKMCENTTFYDNYPTADTSAMSKEIESNETTSRALSKVSISSNESGKGPKKLSKTVAAWSSEESTTESVNSVSDEESDCIDNQPGIYEILDPQIIGSYPCVLVEGLDVIECQFAFGEHAFFLMRGMRINTGESLPDDLRELAERQKSTRGEQQAVSTTHCSYKDVRELYKRRFILQNCAMEIFLSRGRNHLLAFAKDVRNVVFHKLQGLSCQILSDAEQTVSGIARSGLLGTYRIKTVTERWLRDDITNFQYLMHLNTLAGRSYNDLMQYPIFPWILADYTSDTLDLADPDIYRDLSKPMGAQSPERLQQFTKRYGELASLPGHKPYLYGTHYSSAMIVSSFLVRMEPFAQHFLTLQGGQFDLPDRMFHSIQEQWSSAAHNNMADVKELIPEFFYLPDFLLNHNQFELGVKQSGAALGDVVLPPWAKDDAGEFIRIHREALESPYVTQHLHEWIDLVFGCKQTGQAAMDADNVFHHLFYEGAVNIEDIADPLERQATVSFINNFGQMPQQLFKKPHPGKRPREVTLNSEERLAPAPPISTLSESPTNAIKDNLILTGSSWKTMAMNEVIADTEGELLTAALKRESIFRQVRSLSLGLPLFHYMDVLGCPEEPLLRLTAPVGQICSTDKTARAVEHNRAMIPPLYNSYVAWWLPDNSLRFFVNGNLTIIERIQDYQISFCNVPSSSMLITGGTNGLICIWDFHETNKKAKTISMHLRKTLVGHLAMITSLATSLHYSILVSAAKDGSCILWDLNQYQFVRRLTKQESPVSAIHINSATGDIVTCSSNVLALWTINGELLARTRIPTPGGGILSCCMSEVRAWDERSVIVTGSADGVVRFWQVEWVQSDGDYFGDEALSQFASYASSSIGSPTGSVSTVTDGEVEECYPGATLQPLYPGPSLSRKSSVSSISHCQLKWVRSLSLVHSLRRHTAFDADNPEPASITALKFSKNNRQLFVGDLCGRVYCWKGITRPAVAF